MCTKCIMLLVLKIVDHRHFSATAVWIQVCKDQFSGTEAHLLKQDGWWISWKSTIFLSYTISCIFNHLSPRGTVKKIKVGKAILSFLRYFQHRESSPMRSGTLSGSLVFYSRDAELKETSFICSPLRSSLRSAVLRKQMQGFSSLAGRV